MLDKEQIKERLSDRQSSVVANRIGLAVATVNRVKMGIGSPSYSTIAKLSEYLTKYP